MVLGSGFSFIYDAAEDPLHFSIVGDFSGNPLEEFGEFPVAEVTMMAGQTGETLSLLDSSVIVALENGVPHPFTPPEQFSNVFENVVAQVVPEPSKPLLLAFGCAALAACRLDRNRRSTFREYS